MTAVLRAPPVPYLGLMDLSHFEDKLPPGSDAGRLYGAKDIEALFPGGREIASTPWGMAGRRKDRRDYDEDLVHDALARPADDLADIDPRHLRATQPMVTRGGVEYYMGDEYNRTGRTFADQGDVGNVFPVVYSRRNEYRVADWQPEEEHLLLSGHHRATAALLQGRQFQARHIRGGYGAPR
jgi:hypothetical protein